MSDAGEYWESFAGHQLKENERRRHKFINDTKFRALAPYLPVSGRVIEVGVGSGRFLARVGTSGKYSLWALDYSRSALVHAVQNLKSERQDATVVRGNANQMPFSNEQFDVVMSGGLLEHFEDPLPVVREMVRILRFGGILYADIVPRKFSLSRLREVPRMLTNPELAPGVFESSLPKKAWAAIGRGAGLELLVMDSFGVLPPGPLALKPRWSGALWRHLDRTPLADALGFFYVLIGRRI